MIEQKSELLITFQRGVEALVSTLRKEDNTNAKIEALNTIVAGTDDGIQSLIKLNSGADISPEGLKKAMKEGRLFNPQ